MARARNIKPGFFRNADLVELSMTARLLFIGLWTIADRAGRLEDRPKQIKMELFPADDVDCGSCLQELASIGVIDRYESGGVRVIQVVNFSKHQNPHKDEKASTLPDRNGHIAEHAPTPKKHGASTVQAPCKDGGNPADSLLLIPDSRILNPEPLSSEAKASGVPPAPRDEKQELYAAGKSLLELRGMPKAQCGSFITKLTKDYGQEVALDAVRASVQAQPLEATEYLIATCQRLKGERKDTGPPITVPSKAADETARLLATQAAHAAQAVSGAGAVARAAEIRAKLVGAA